MKITFPHMGSLYIPVEALFQELGFEVVVPPPCTKRTLELGSRYSPEIACLPLKVMIGNYLEAAELGADTIAMIGGCGPCRLGYYAEVQRQILADLGSTLDMVVIETPLENPSRLARDAAKILGRGKLSRVPRALILAWEKLKACESLEKTALRVRPKEEKPGLTTRVLELALQKVRQAAAVRTVHKAVQEGIGELWAVQEKHGRQDPIIIGLVGEIYTVFEPFVNLRLEERLGHLGVEVARTISLVQWVKDHVFKGSIGLYRTTHLERSAEGFLSGFVGGHGLETIARSNELANCGAAGVVQILPFTCMPEVIAQAILPDVSRAKELPILSLVVDEHTGEAGFQTRIEAFVDLLSRKRREAYRGQTQSLFGSRCGFGQY
ncbi:MAG: CoA protein activase [Firmicutes bacterium]|nr:CoA protein activase [Bacillota bacterium]